MNATDYDADLNKVNKNIL